MDQIDTTDKSVRWILWSHEDKAYLRNRTHTLLTSVFYRHAPEDVAKLLACIGAVVPDDPTREDILRVYEAVLAQHGASVLSRPYLQELYDNWLQVLRSIVFSNPPVSES